MIAEVGSIMFRTIYAYLTSLLEAFSAAQMVSAAIAVRRVPNSSALKRLGIDPETYRRIRDY
jgi:hypothetical protein